MKMGCSNWPCTEWASKARWTQRRGGRRRRGTCHNKAVLVPSWPQGQLQPWTSSWQWLSQELKLLPTELPAGKSCSFSSPLCQINADYTTLPLLLTDTSQCCCSLWQSAWLGSASCPCCAVSWVLRENRSGGGNLPWLHWFTCSHSSFVWICVSVGGTQREFDKIAFFVWLRMWELNFLKWNKVLSGFGQWYKMT